MDSFTTWYIVLREPCYVLLIVVLNQPQWQAVCQILLLLLHELHVLRELLRCSIFLFLYKTH
jgi:hypothetical protein